MGRTAGYSKKNYNYRMDPYIEGNVVPNTAGSNAARSHAARSGAAPKRRHTEELRPSVSKKTRSNREKALQINVGYVVFLMAAAVVTLFVCVRFLQLQAESTTHRKKVASMASQLSTLKMENDTAYEDAVSSLELAQIKDIAIHDLGMVYANEGHIITYDSQDSDYVRQYEAVPVE